MLVAKDTAYDCCVPGECSYCQDTISMIWVTIPSVIGKIEGIQKLINPNDC